MGFANSPATRNALASHGIRVSGYRWQWGLGLKGGTFPPHYHQNGEHGATADSFDAAPGEDVNGDSCMCALVPVYRDEAGRFAKPGLDPIFQPPTTAAIQFQPDPIDWGPLTAAITAITEREQPPVYVNVAPSELEVTLPDIRMPEFPTFDLQAPQVTVEPAQVTVNIPPVDPVPDRESVYFAGISGKVVIPEGHAVVGWAATTGTKAGSVKLGANPTITVPANTGAADEPDPMDVRSVTFTRTVAYFVRAVRQ